MDGRRTNQLTVPLGVKFKEVVTLVTLVGTGQADACSLTSRRRACAAGVQRLPLHVALKHRTIPFETKRDGLVSGQTR